MQDPTHYEVLEVPLDASPQQISRAYRIARSTYEPGSAATYSLLSEDEAAESLRRVEAAYAVLSDERLRQEYDARLRGAGTLERAQRAPATFPDEVIRPVRRTLESHDDVEEPELPEDGVYDGEILRRIRMSRGIEIDEVSNITKIGIESLRAIEANQLDLLPAPVYLKGFLREVARCLRLDPRQVADSYIQGSQAKKG